MSHVPLTAGKTIPFTPDAIGTFVAATDKKPAHVIKHPEIEFSLRVPNWEDRDLISLRMYALGVRNVTSENIQNLVISELFEVMDENAADEAARFLEGFWNRQRQHQMDMQQFHEQEAIRIGDQIEAGKTFQPDDVPPEPTTARERARANTLVADVTDGSQRLRDKLADQQLYQKRFGMTVVRFQLAGWKGLKTEAVFDKAPTQDAPTLTKETIEGLRGELMELDHTGAAWEELCVFAEHMFDLPRSAEKNLSSPRASSSRRSGSKTRSTASETSDGSSSTSEATDAK